MRLLAPVNELPLARPSTAVPVLRAAAIRACSGPLPASAPWRSCLYALGPLLRSSADCFRRSSARASAARRFSRQ